MEEALIAPDIAVNRSEAPPAIRTEQIEAGARIGLTSTVSLVAAAFSISKPYYNLDPVLQYRQLGTVRNRGIELSLTGEVWPGFTVVGGTVFTDPQISGEAVATGLIARQPVGQVKRRSVLSVDWRTSSGKGPLSFDVRLENVSDRVANAQNKLFAPGFTTIDLGARYRFEARGLPMVVRLELQNALNRYGWRVSSSGGFSYSNPRTAAISLIGDF